jgi:hypothetical protein
MTALWIPVLLAATAPSAGVVVVGERDVPPAVVARTQAEVELRIAGSSRLTLVSGIELGRTLGEATAAAPGAEAATRAEAAARIDAAKTALYAGSFANAIRALDEAEKIQDGVPGLRIEDRVTTALWRITVHLAAGDEAAAKKAAQDVARLAPGYEVSLDQFAPNVKALVDGGSRRAPYR